MMMLVVDTNILVKELLRQRGRQLIEHPGLTLYVTERVLDETQYELRRRMTARVSRGGPQFGLKIVISWGAAVRLGRRKLY